MIVYSLQILLLAVIWQLLVVKNR